MKYYPPGEKSESGKSNALSSFPWINPRKSLKGLRAKGAIGLYPKSGPLKNDLPVNFFIRPMSNIQIENNRLEEKKEISSFFQSDFRFFYSPNQKSEILRVDQRLGASTISTLNSLAWLGSSLKMTIKGAALPEGIIMSCLF